MTQTPFTSTLACTQAAKQLDQLQQHKGETITSLESMVERIEQQPERTAAQKVYGVVSTLYELSNWAEIEGLCVVVKHKEGIFLIPNRELSGDELKLMLMSADTHAKETA